MRMRTSFIEGVIAKKKPAIAGFFKLQLKRVLCSHHINIFFIKPLTVIQVIVLPLITKISS